MDDKPLNILLVEDDEIDIMNVKWAFKKSNILNLLHFARDGTELYRTNRRGAEFLG